MKNVFLARNQLAALGAPWGPQVTVVGPMQPFDNEASTAIYNEILRCHTFGPGSRPLLMGVETLVWYLGGNVLEWYDHLLVAGKTRFCTFYPDTVGFEADAIRERARTGEGAISWWAFQCDLYYGLFFKIASHATSLALSGIIDDDRKPSRIDAFPEDQRQRALGLLKLAYKGVVSFWPVL
jgi:hypothetical protein